VKVGRTKIHFSKITKEIKAPRPGGAGRKKRIGLRVSDHHMNSFKKEIGSTREGSSSGETQRAKGGA